MMTDTPRRRIKQTTGYRPPFDIERKVNALVESGEFANKSDAYTAAFRFWLNYRQYDVKKALTDLLQTEEGRQLVRDAVKKNAKK